VTVTQAAFDDAVHVQLDCVVTVIVPVLADGDAVTAVGVNENVHGPPGCVIVNVSPPIVSVPVREAPVLAVTP